MPVYDPNNPGLVSNCGSGGRLDINRTSFAGLSLSQVQTYYTQFQTAYFALVQGGKPVTVSYEGKSVTYTQADVGQLKNLMDEAAQLLGYGRQRRALRPVFR